MNSHGPDRGGVGAGRCSTARDETVLTSPARVTLVNTIHTTYFADIPAPLPFALRIRRKVQL